MKKDNLRSFRYHCRLRLAAVFEGLRNMYYDYAHQKGEEISGLRRDVYGKMAQVVAESDEDSDEDGMMD